MVLEFVAQVARVDKLANSNFHLESFRVSKIVEGVDLRFLKEQETNHQEEQKRQRKNLC